MQHVALRSSSEHGPEFRGRELRVVHGDDFTGPSEQVDPVGDASIGDKEEVIRVKGLWCFTPSN